VALAALIKLDLLSGELLRREQGGPKLSKDAFEALDELEINEAQS